MQQTLFDLPEKELIKSKYTCIHCTHRQRWQCGGKTIQYYGKRKSNRTFNGLLKIKVTNEACMLFEKND